ncbi:MAG: hypothetical protein JWN70_3846 [Planctomycetaceae bacterium]|nr:hypothetical protein [Planctomycetaceae bacterium]
MRRQLVLLFLGLIVVATAPLSAGEPVFRLATFSSDVTPPLGHPLLAGATIAPPVKRIDDPLFARGFVLLGAEKPLVVVSVDWCEIRNDAYDRWRDVLAEAAGTDRARVLVTAIHQHDVPLPDLEAQRILDRHGAKSKIFDLEFHEKTVQAAAQALRASLAEARTVTHIGTGQATITHLVSNRRYVDQAGKIWFDRSSMSGGKAPQAESAEGLVDPQLKTLSFWNGETPLCALNVFAIHPMSYWGTGWVTSDFPGLARERRQADDPKVFQIYASGASGNLTAGKFNNGNHENRSVLTNKLYEGMIAAWKSTKRQPLTAATFRAPPLRLEPRNDAGYTVEDMTRLLSHPDPRKQSVGALGLSWRKRADAGHVLEIPAIDFGSACLMLLPGESYLEYQLLAQRLRPDAFVVVMGYGESAPGYIGTDRAWDEDDGNLHDWCWVGRSESAMTKAIHAALNVTDK